MLQCCNISNPPGCCSLSRAPGGPDRYLVGTFNSGDDPKNDWKINQ
jgi:hypothetical protein